MDSSRPDKGATEAPHQILAEVLPEGDPPGKEKIQDLDKKTQEQQKTSEQEQDAERREMSTERESPNSVSSESTLSSNIVSGTEEDDVKEAGGGGDSTTAGQAVQDGHKENKAGCEVDAEKADATQNPTGTSTTNEAESDNAVAGGHTVAVADAIKCPQEGEAVKATSKDLPTETTDELDKTAPEATAVDDAAAEEDTSGANTEAQEEDKANEGVCSGDASGGPSAEAPTVSQAAARDDDSPKIKPKVYDGDQQTKKTIERRTGEDQAEQTPPSTTKPPLHLRPVIGAVLFAVLAVLVFQLLRPTAELKRPNLGRVEVLKEEMAKVEQSFRSQRTELWRRSRIHLQRHLKSPQPSEPVSLILVGGRRAERTLGCLAARLAKAFSSALNGSVLQVDGASLANIDHDQVKLDLDNQLKEAFEDDKPAAVIHRLEELPPSSTLIFYRYCDHENAAYKHPLLAFTVLLPQDAVGPEFSISQVEEMVHSHIHTKFLTPSQPDTFDKMDVDKLSGLWSRISHLILPVNMEEHMEKEGCDRN